MAEKESSPRKKGTFSHLRLPVTRKYVFPITRSQMLMIGGIVGGGILLYGIFSSIVQSGSFISNGPLASKHATLEDSCSSCHVQTASLFGAGSVTNDKCSVCHEKFGDKLGVYTWGAHYVYRSRDLSRNITHDNEFPCFKCHVEHEGKLADLTDVPDARCLPCHQFGSFNDRHPEFSFVRNTKPDDANLRFPHVKHVIEVKKREHISDNEQACLYCHHPKPDGKTFEPLSFEQQCSSCHLTGEDETPPLPVARNAQSPGVETLAMMRRSKGPGTLWANYTSGNEFQEAGDLVIKHPVYHEDPWIMENLNRLRSQMYPGLGIAELLQSSADLPNDDARTLYREALKTLKNYAEGLRSRPEAAVQEDLVRIETVIAQIERDLQDPYTPLDKTKFLLGAVERNPDIKDFDKYQAVVDSLTTRCRRCHMVEKASIMRVQKDQGVLRRAEFDHRAHILQKGCLDCHNRIPIKEAIENPAHVDLAKDVASVQNIPSIETCQQCHNRSKASNRCITCHTMHPNKTQRSNLLLYVHE